MNASTILMTGLAGFLLTALATGPLGRLAIRWGITDRPGGYKAHARPIPYLGGVAIMLGTVAPVIVIVGLNDLTLAVVICAAVAVALLGLIDDIAPLSPIARLGVESVAAAGVVLGGLHAPVTGGWPDVPLTILWIVLITNSFNLLDNQDGSLGAITAAGAAPLAVTAFVAGRPMIGMMLTALCCAGVGFLLHNWAPARVFMGDSGSLFIGFVVACSATAVARDEAPDQVIGTLLLPTFVATIDTGVVLLSRARAGRPLLLGATDHLSHRLNALGLSVGGTTLVLAGAAALSGALNLAMTLRLTPPLITTVAAVAAVIVLIGLLQKAHSPVPGPAGEPAVSITERR
ncbi:undecaprenyl-phosphate alpha-N-acetylglucosaminyl 1-phosphate transferase [Sphaerisporangium siamense]|uniref:UDP-GlcNAc:undecaprenyl-phosphate GlcNAc-1-phosphate transferase n=1 Tax=Sphaerisporangium siamense TaxID=795645 RepID=A0A7W7DBK8_9ACTN|nr:MraY family glycosyltransferase [Sphaerisporangium siamense]MBB4702980.1 UDP-GlcNAc:undecaprenyl-phosphate GlcNAc-1-phosphate transferase [Sphaerisporangium siamense]GII83260.1 undecaprenyl-phosphate alpha-N-acetylglucosaminyl 1-phosphate transferase [Sphaerisporangium siamense]